MVLNLFRAYKEVQYYTPNQCILTNKCVIFTLSLHKAQASTYELSMDICFSQNGSISLILGHCLHIYKISLYINSQFKENAFLFRLSFFFKLREIPRNPLSSAILTYVWTYFNVNLFSIYKKYTNLSCFSVTVYLYIFSQWELLSSLFSFPLIIFNFKFLFPIIFFFSFLSSYLFTFLHLTCRTVVIVEIIFDPHIHKNYQKQIWT